jgi:hypothetical protein
MCSAVSSLFAIYVYAVRIRALPRRTHLRIIGEERPRACAVGVPLALLGGVIGSSFSFSRTKARFKKQKKLSVLLLDVGIS